MQSQTVQERAASKEESQLVTFLLKDEEFGFDIMSVQEIIRLPKMAKVPRTPPYVEGIANLRGVVLPIIDMRTRFGMERAEETDRTRVLVVDIDGVKTGLRVDRVQQVTRVLRSDVDPPPPAIRGSTANYLEGVVKLDNGQRIIMSLNAAQVCHIDDSTRRTEAAAAAGGSSGQAAETAGSGATTADAIAQMVTFRIAKEEFAFEMKHVREILRVQAPKQVPDVPEYVLGVLTVRGQILPIVDLRRLLHQQSLADEFCGSCREIRESYERWTERSGGNQAGRTDLSAPERLRAWISAANSSSQVLMETLSKVRGFNERTIKQVQTHAPAEEIAASVSAVIAGLHDFEREVAANIHEDQRIIVVDAGGFVLGLVVDHVNEVLNVLRKLLDPPPMVTSAGGLELEAVAKLEDGNRLIMLLDVANLMWDQKLREIQTESAGEAAKDTQTDAENTDTDQERSEVQLVTFLLGGEEYGVPISQIQEIDRLSKITKVPKAAQFVEGVTNLRGEVIPVLDTRKRFDLETKASDDRSRIIIVELGGVKTGLIVDSVREVLSLPRRDIAPPPEAIHSGIDQQFISGIGKVDSGKRMVVLLDVEKILSKTEQAELAEVPAN